MGSDDAFHGIPSLDGSTLAALWAVVLLELLLPVPGVLTLGAIYVLLRRPRWFLLLVLRRYAAAFRDRSP